ncbi:tetratricopeptide repeat protein [Lacinutrix algicola]|uniref:tetratricopeptide repeat protein n=1 Tax=Lacinutrix algicola TaxID=342954 RepID=UPI0006E19735|nr:tetratricopeptide repeat protein [Lacinutrix algicola]
MKTKAFIYTLLFALIVSCGKSANYTPEFIKDTTGRYLFNANEVIEVYFENNELFLKWRGAEKIEPLYLDENTYFIKEMNKKIQFLKHPETQVFYISEVPEDEETEITYNYKKLEDSVQVPSTYLKNEQYSEALEGYLAIQKEDSTSVFIKENGFNRLGYSKLREKKYKEAIEVFKINVALHAESDNVYDSLADAYVKNGDSLEAYNNYKKALQYNNGNRSAKRFVAAYNKK